MTRILIVAAAVLLTIAGSDQPASQTAHDQNPEARNPACANEAIPPGFASATAEVNGTTLRYVAGGHGPSLILLHGFPEDWSAWAEIMPRLGSRFRVVAVDLRGIGGSPPQGSDYRAATMAEDIYQLARSLGLNQPYVVGHDVGGQVAYALARLHPKTLRGAMIVDVPIAGVDPWDEIKVDPQLWHFGFHAAPGLAETLLAGREAVYFDYFLRNAVADPGSISDGDIQRYACAYSLPGRMAAAMGMYRVFEQDEAFGRERRDPLDVPIVLVGGDKSFGPLLPQVAKGLEKAGGRSVTVESVAGGGHYLADEKPAEIAGLIERHASVDRHSP